MDNLDLDRAKKVMVEILVEIDDICNRNKINYWLDLGTLLGAIRHKGFIPWDDDFDIGVKIKDYIEDYVVEILLLMIFLLSETFH